MTKLTLSKLESQLRNLVEGSTDWLFPSTHNGRDLASQMAKAMRGRIRINPDGEAVAPNLFTIEAHPDQAEMMAADQAFCEGSIQILRQQGEEAGLKFSSPLAIRVIPTNDLALGELRVQARHSLAEVSKTDAMQVESGEENTPNELPPNAFLIVDGTQIFPLTQTVINIGRRADNHLVINDGRVSRLHAQLRLVGSSFVIFDLDSAGGTFVNGQRIHQATLQAGDVISLSDLPLVYGQDAIPGEATQQMIANP